MLQIRPLVRKFFWFKIGNGRSAHVWSDNWCVHSPLNDVIASNDIISAGFSVDARVQDLITNAEWNWPMHWNLMLPNITLPILNNEEDLLYWKDRDGNLKDFSVAVVWNDLRPRKDKVDWSEIVWFSCCIPRHAFILWLVFRKKLKTQDVLMQWDWNPSMDLLCPFCKLVPDSHSHLFFDCTVTMQIWNQVTKKVSPLPTPSSWSAIIANLMPRAKRKSLHVVLEKLVLAASVYFVWQERNARLFTKTARSPNVLSETIIATIKLKLVTLRYKSTSSVEHLLAAWDLPVSLTNNV